MSTEIKPCKIHNIMPEWVDVEYTYEQLVLRSSRTYRALRCKECENEKRQSIEEIIRWNKDQSK